MTAARPVIAALDPHRDDAGAARLGLLLARVTGAPLLLASAYMADPSADRLAPEYLEAVRAEALASVEQQRAGLLVLARARDRDPARPRVRSRRGS